MPKYGTDATSARRATARRHYVKNREKILANAAKRRAERGSELAEEKRARRKALQERAIEAKSVPCVDCGIAYPTYVMDFDHVRGEKLANVAYVVKNAVSMEMLEDEIAKCDVVCSNCHRIRTHTRHQCGAST